MSEEDVRAAAWRVSQRRRKAGERARLAMLQGSPEARKVLEDEWRAVRSWLAERRSR